ncbi:fimbrial protein [Citrobacter braakii]|uniref:fimbrial protein n=1 Tax=Citrobacter braakii TaxID=57706 RepID=UPI00351CC547
MKVLIKLKKNIFKKIIIPFTLLMCGYVSNVMAGCSTTDYSGQTQYNNTVAITGGDFSAGSELPVGTVIRRQRIIGLRDVKGNCSSPVIIKGTFFSGSLYPGQTNIFKTGVDGLGVRFKSLATGTYFPFSQPTGVGVFLFSRQSHLAYDMEFVKMGVISAGQVNAASFPVLVVDADDGTNGPAWAMRGYYSGGFSIRVPTCTTPDYSYDLGTFGISSFENTGDSSSWREAPIILTGCNSFYGNNANSSFTQYTMTGSNTGNVVESGSLAPVNIYVTLTPVTTPVDIDKGILSLDSSATAKGVGVQIGFKSGNLFTPQNLKKDFIVTPPIGVTGNISIPLAARVFRINQSMSPGTIRSSVTYTINYK